MICNLARLRGGELAEFLIGETGMQPRQVLPGQFENREWILITLKPRYLSMHPDLARPPSGLKARSLRSSPMPVIVRDESPMDDLQVLDCSGAAHLKEVLADTAVAARRPCRRPR